MYTNRHILRHPKRHIQNNIVVEVLLKKQQFWVRGSGGGEGG